jgi:hypothetical protein
MSSDPQVNDIYTFYLPDKGWTLFRYMGEDSSYHSIDSNGKDLHVYRYINSSETTTAKDGNREVINSLTISKGRAKIYHSRKLSRDGFNIVRDPKLSSCYTPTSTRIKSGSSEMQTLLDDQVIMAFFESITSVLPFAESMTLLLNSVTQAGACIQKSIINKTEACIALQQKMKAFLDTINNLSIVKLMQDPRFLLGMGIPLAFLGIIVAILAGSLLFTPLGALLLVFIIAVIIIALVAWFYIEAKRSADQKKLDELDNEIGSDPLFHGAIMDAKKMVNTMAGVIVGILLAVAFLSALSGYIPIVGQLSAIAMIAALMAAAGAALAGFSMAINGLLKVFKGFLDKESAPIIEDISIENAHLQAWEAESSFYTSMQERLTQALKSIWEYLEQSYKAQSELIKTLSEGATTITRSIAI